MSFVQSPVSHSARTYTPGYKWYKMAMIIYGVILFSIGLINIWVPVKLLFYGQRVTAEVASVVKTKNGLADLVLTDQDKVKSNLEPTDFSYLFWNEFSFQLKDSRTVVVRCPVGSRLKPLFPLIDDQGLPSSSWIYYDPSDPRVVVFPLVVSTWFAPGVFIVVGVLCSIIGAFLYYWANIPIELPRSSDAT